MLTNEDTKYWAPNPAILKHLAGQIAEGARVLEIGPGTVPFSRATSFVDWRGGLNAIACDLSRDCLPFANKEFDFVYCRHVVEDLYNPFLACDEMSRVAHAGYIETPSPLAEVCRGIDGSSPPWRGYHHHRYFVWTDDDALFFTPKYPILEHISFGDEGVIADALKGNQFLWNSYYSWKGRINWRLLQHDVDYTIGGTYRGIILKAIKQGMINANHQEAGCLKYSKSTPEVPN